MKDNLPYRSRQEFELTFKFPATVVYEQFLHINSRSWKRTLLGGRHESRNFTVYNFAGLGAEARWIVLAKQRDVQKKNDNSRIDVVKSYPREYVRLSRKLQERATDKEYIGVHAMLSIPLLELRVSLPFT